MRVPVFLCLLARHAVGSDVECRRSIGAAWVPSTHDIGFIHHKNRCTFDESEVSRTSFHPAACPGIDAASAAVCLGRRRLRRVVFVGDSIAGQLWGSPLCRNATARGFGAGNGAVETSNYGFFSISTATLGGLVWTYVRLHAKQRADTFSRALRDAFEAGLLLDRAYWVVNAGLWHLVCDADDDGDDCIDSALSLIHI